MLDKRLILETVDLSSYSSSKGWSGFYEVKSKSACHVKEVIDGHWDLFSSESPQTEMATSLYFDVDVRDVASFYGIDYQMLRDRVTPLAENGVLEMKNLYWKDDNYESEAYETYIECLETSFRILNSPSQEFLKTSLEVRMCLNGVSGHCFLYHPKLSCLSYPHEDLGFGFIFLESAVDEQRRALQSIVKRLDKELRWVPAEAVHRREAQDSCGTDSSSP